MADLSGLTIEEQSLYWTGVIVRADVMIENQLNQMFASLTGPPAVALAPDGIARHLEALRRLIKADPSLRNELQDVLLDLLNEVEQAHRERSTLVHSWWHPDSAPDASPDQFVRAGLAFTTRRQDRSPRSLQDFERCADRLYVCSFRLVGAGMLVSGHFLKVMGQSIPGFGAEQDAKNFAIASGRFERQQDGGFRLL